jgi:hypothetical protein
MTTKGHRRFLAIMVAIFGGFKTKFSGIARPRISGLDPGERVPALEIL